jgi:aminotransferase
MPDRPANEVFLPSPGHVPHSFRLVHKTGVATVPGSAFFSDPALGLNQVRFAFCKKVETLQKALLLLKDAGLEHPA